MIHVNSYGVRTLHPEPDEDGLGDGIRVVREPYYDRAGDIPGAFVVLWWSDFLCPKCMEFHRDDVNARFDRETLTELRDEIQRVLDEDAADA